VVLDCKGATAWPDILGSGDYPAFIVSERALSAFEQSGVAVYRGGRVHVASVLPPPLARRAPAYSWVDGARHLGARLDFEASGYVGVAFCPECGRRTEDIAATYRVQHASVVPTRILEHTWNGADLFTTDLSPTAFFCTARVVESARRALITNARVVPAEQGAHGEALELSAAHGSEPR
jgi:hypothetical protein